MNLRVILFLIGIFLINTTHAQQYHLFKPVPRAELREFALDRPDVTESPQTVDAGHFQFEGDVLKWVKQNGGISERTINIWNGLYKLGLTNNWDIHFGYEAYNINRNDDGDKLDEGGGAFTIRLKRNFWGNNGDTKTALGAIPYVTFPTGNPFEKNQDVAFGVGFPFSCDINGKLGWGAQPQFDFVPNAEGGYDLSFFQTVVLGGTVIGDLDFYAEAVSIFAKDENQYLANGGLIYNISPNVKVDIATNIGLNKPAPTKIYLGLSFRI
ncbi:MAG: transporter [Cyclobacteriaceae bacterium]|jgi:hypothetical protein|nr:transporter [Cyclobacteriaceae bacterium]